MCPLTQVNIGGQRVKAPRIESHGPMRFIGVQGSVTEQTVGSAQPETVPELWAAFTASGQRPTEVLGDAHYGISFLLPVPERAALDQMQYLAGVRVPLNLAAPPQLKVKDVAAQTYAIFTHAGPVREFARTIRFAFAQWLPSSGYRFAQAPTLEVYDDRFRPREQSSLMEYWLPVIRQ